MQTHETTAPPLVLLDVDGVINDLGALYGRSRPWYVHEVLSNGYVLHIPEYMPALVADLVDAAEVWWCTTWRERANDELAEFLGIDRLPVVDDGSQSRNVEWKPAAARAIAKAALDAGREVFWIEDFYGILPTTAMPEGVVFIDTTTDPDGAVLTEDMLPTRLQLAVGSTSSV